MEARASTRIMLTVHYDGAAFHGWQLQPDQRTVQGVLEATLSRLADRECSIIGSGRTDTGVHATGQVAAVDLPARWTPEELRRALNALLPDDVWVESTAAASSDFHPRYDAVARTYDYQIGLLPLSASPFHRKWCWPLGEPLERTLLDRGAGALVGAHTFEAFSKAGQPERGYECTVLSAGWSDWSLGVRFSIVANRYLHHMVRYLVGTLVDVARGRRPLDDVERLLANEADVTTSPPAPPQGLFLSRVEYPDSVLLGHATLRSTATA